jgi:hypothetical protein
MLDQGPPSRSRCPNSGHAGLSIGDHSCPCRAGAGLVWPVPMLPACAVSLLHQREDQECEISPGNSAALQLRFVETPLVCTDIAKRGPETFRLPMQWLTSVCRGTHLRSNNAFHGPANRRR